ncbi:superinfection exclusion B family protein [Synechococcus sp. BO 8801]|uniref:superinfection exclusion B family protein n=1 Tax=Synechococcus sp. BO 8801 TaxID=169670 RepID=UPI000B9898D1
MIDVEKLLSVLKAAPYVFLGLAIASGTALFAPPAFQSALGIVSLLSTHRVWVGGTFLVSMSIFVSAVGARATKLVSPVLLDQWNVRQHRKKLKVLSPPEQKVLAAYLNANTTTLPQPYSNGVVGGLVAKKILYWASNIGHPGTTAFDCNLQPWAWQELRKHPEHVGLPRK